MSHSLLDCNNEVLQSLFLYLSPGCPAPYTSFHFAQTHMGAPVPQKVSLICRYWEFSEGPNLILFHSLQFESIIY